MASTEAGVCNIALARIGNREFIDSLTEDTTQAQVCNALFADARDAVLARVPWKFATRRAALAQLSGVERDGWEYAYALPSDCLAPRYLYAGVRNPASDQRIPFELEDDGAAGKLILLTDHDGPSLVYTYRATAVGLFPPLFVDALAWRLAGDLARALMLKPGVADAVDRRAELVLMQAGAAELRKAQEDVPPDAEHIRER